MRGQESEPQSLTKRRSTHSKIILEPVHRRSRSQLQQSQVKSKEEDLKPLVKQKSPFQVANPTVLPTQQNSPLSATQYQQRRFNPGVHNPKLHAKNLIHYQTKHAKKRTQQITERPSKGQEEAVKPKNSIHPILSKDPQVELSLEERPILKIKKDILNDLKELRKQKAARLLQLKNQNATIIQEDSQVKFFHTEVVQNPGNKVVVLTEEASIQKIEESQEYLHTPVNNSTIKELDEFSLNFPMRNSRLSQAVMASITMEANKSVGRSHVQASQRYTHDSANRLDQKSLAAATNGPTPTPQNTFNNGFVVAPITADLEGGGLARILQKQNSVGQAASTTRSKQGGILTPNPTGELFTLPVPSPPLIQPQQSIFDELSIQGTIGGDSSIKDFMKQYFKDKKDPMVKDADLKQRMILVRKAVAQLEREHFNAQKSARQNNMTAQKSPNNRSDDGIVATPQIGQNSQN